MSSTCECAEHAHEGRTDRMLVVLHNLVPEYAGNAGVGDRIARGS